MSKKGFTLIEVLLAITIIGVLSGFVVVQMNGAANATKDAKRKADIDLIKNAVVSYRTENYSKTPVEDCKISECASLPAALQPFLATLPDDPNAGSDYRYVSDGTSCTIYATLSDGSIYKYDCQSNATASVFPVNGACGADDGRTIDYTSTPTALCNTGTPSAVTGAGPWYWSCAGENTGTTATCWAKLSDVFTCSITSGSCSGINLFNVYDPAGGHAEMNDQTNYSYKVCCVGGGLAVNNITTSDQCATGKTAVLKLYDITKSHVEKGDQSNYTNKVCISAIGKVASCVYTTSCATGYTCIASVSDGDTSLHVGDCGVFATKVCCKVSLY